MKSKDQKRVLIYCLAMNFTSLLILASLVISFSDGGGYITFGPSQHLYILSIKIDNWLKWTVCLLVIGGLNACEVLTNDFAIPILEFTIYNPEKTHIVGFTINEMNFFANSMWALNSIRKIFMIVVSITQFDLALGSVAISEIAQAYSTRTMLKQRTFVPEQDDIEPLQDMKKQRLLFSEEIV
jgi:hypothetical protein